jgi:hypothetical protein
MCSLMMVIYAPFQPMEKIYVHPLVQPVSVDTGMGIAAYGQAAHGKLKQYCRAPHFMQQCHIYISLGHALC